MNTQKYDPTQTGIYALDAMTPAEAAEFRAAMLRDESARSEATELTDTATQLGLSVAPIQPSAGLRASILDAIENLPQEAGPAKPVGPREAEALRRWSTRTTAFVASAAAAVVLIAGGIVAGIALGSSTTSSVSAEVASIQNAADSQSRTVSVAGGGTATLAWSHTVGRADIRVTNIPALAAGKIYELWYIRDGNATPAGTFTVGSNGSRQVVLTGRYSIGDTVGMTVEPASGSAHPTSAPILAVTTT